MNAVIVSCKKCGMGQVPLIPDEDEVCACVQCGAGHDINGELLISEAERQEILKIVSGNEDDNGGQENTRHNKRKRMYKKLGDGEKVYGNGCSRYPDCLSCPFDDCVATYRYGNIGANKPYFVMSAGRNNA